MTATEPSIHEAAAGSGVRSELWIVPGFGHAESAVSTEILYRIGAWARECAVDVTGSGSS